MANRDDDSQHAPAPGGAEDQRQPRDGDRCGCGAGYSQGHCQDTGLYPRYVWRREGRERFTLSLSCPFACPCCGGGLEWDGGCHACHGSVTSWDRDTWTFPGDRYEREAGHWVKTDGPRRAGTRSEHLACLDLQRRQLAGQLGRLEALTELAGILTGHGGIPWDLQEDRQTFAGRG